MNVESIRSSVARQDKTLSLLEMLRPDVLAAPNKFYRILREVDPVHWDPYMHAWVVTSYREVTTVLGYCSADRSPSPEYLEMLGLSFFKPFAETMKKQMLFMDGAMHRRLRGLCSMAFTPGRVDQLRTLIEQVANELLDKVMVSGRLDMIADFAAPLPAIVTAKLLGIPVEDHEQIGNWVNDIAEVHGNFQHHPDRVTEVLRSLQNLKRYISGRMNELRRFPNAGLICSLMTAEMDGTRLSDDEVIANAIVMVIGGHETTTNLIASGFLTLLRNHGAFEQLRCHPEITCTAIEELLRYESPVQHTARIAPEDMPLGGKTLNKGSRVVAVLAAANRDPSRFPDPDCLDLLRSDNHHLAFGWGGHFCFGAPLARVEGQIAFNTLLRRLQSPFLIDQEPGWRLNAGLRGLTRLLIGFDPGANAAHA
jgi:pimeloyl-[acyl-carrier protein] synthase